MPACLFLLLVSIGMGLGAEYVIDIIQKAAEELRNPQLYINAVFGVG
jgi:formate hydrogenlyase subunit 3/multisubunit Na+/H+ antiporter MnhD subunit